MRERDGDGGDDREEHVYRAVSMSFYSKCFLWKLNNWSGDDAEISFVVRGFITWIMSC